MPYPYVSKPVHYVAEPDENGYTTQCRAAIVTNVLPVPELVMPGTFVNLLVIDDTSETHVVNSQFSEDTAPYVPGTWHEPEPVF